MWNCDIAGSDLMFLRTLVNLFVLLGLSASLQASERPNILFIMSDDHAVRAVSAYGNSVVDTPSIDRIAKNGMRFDRAYVGNSICGPSRATMLTGLHSHANGFYSNEWSGAFDGTQQTLPDLLQRAGYNTAVIGKWHLYSDPIGFDHWEVIHNLFEQGTYYNPEFRSEEGVEITSGYVADLITDKAIAWLQSISTSPEPFFLVYNHKTPHRDWLPGPAELDEWNEDLKIEEPSTLTRDTTALSKARREARMSIADYMTDRDVKLSQPENLTDAQAAKWHQAFDDGNEKFDKGDWTAEQRLRWKYQRYIKTYTASVESMDREIGRLLDYLERSGLADNTIVIYTSDQGFFLGENGWFDKRWMDEASSRTPLLIQWPGHIEPGSVSTSMVQNIDFAPTLLDAAGIVPKDAMHGVSLLPVFNKPGYLQDRDLYYHFYENPGFHGVARHYGVHTGRYKLIHYYRNDEWELFDLESDPQELENLYGQAGYENVINDLEKRLAALRRQYQVPEKEPEAPWYHDTLIRAFEHLMQIL